MDADGDPPSLHYGAAGDWRRRSQCGAPNTSSAGCRLGWSGRAGARRSVSTTVDFLLHEWLLAHFENGEKLTVMFSVEAAVGQANGAEIFGKNGRKL